MNFPRGRIRPHRRCFHSVFGSHAVQQRIPLFSCKRSTRSFRIRALDLPGFHFHAAVRIFHRILICGNNGFAAVRIIHGAGAGIIFLYAAGRNLMHLTGWICIGSFIVIPDAAVLIRFNPGSQGGSTNTQEETNAERQQKQLPPGLIPPFHPYVFSLQFPAFRPVRRTDSNRLMIPEYADFVNKNAMIL